MTSASPDLCSPWVGYDDVHRLNKYAKLTEEQLSPYYMPASELCWKLSGRVWRGICTLTGLRPCRQPGSIGLSHWPSPVGTGLVPNWWQNQTQVWWGRCGCNGDAWLGTCTCSDGINQLDMEPYTPLVNVTRVKIDGDVLDPAKYGVFDYRWLARFDGHLWPLVNRLDLADTERETWSVDLEYGVMPPADAQVAAATLVGELALAANPGAGTCILPERIQTVVRQGITYIVADPQAYLDAGRTGIYLIDLWLRATNPSGLTSGATLSFPGHAGLPGRIRTS